MAALIRVWFIIFFTTLYQLFTKVVIENDPEKNLINFLSAVWKNPQSAFNNISLYMELVSTLVYK